MSSRTRDRPTSVPGPASIRGVDAHLTPSFLVFGPGLLTTGSGRHRLPQVTCHPLQPWSFHPEDLSRDLLPRMSSLELPPNPHRGLFLSQRSWESHRRRCASSAYRLCMAETQILSPSHSPRKTNTRCHARCNPLSPRRASPLEPKAWLKAGR